jgi:hypothetical protein
MYQKITQEITRGLVEGHHLIDSPEWALFELCNELGIGTSV